MTGNVPGCRCDLCPLRTDRQHKQPITDETPVHAEVLFIGEAPGKNEVEFLKPFVGASGEELHTYLRAGRLTRGDVAIANVLLCRPPTDLDDYLKDVADRNAERVKVNAERGRAPGDTGFESPLPDPRDCCRPRLMTYLPGKQMIIPLGGTALEAVTGLDKISFWRGSPLRVERFLDPPPNYEGPAGSPLPARQPPHGVRGDVRETRADDEVWVLPSLHPAYTLHEGPGRVMRGVVAHDVAKALRILKDDRISWTEPNFELSPHSVDAVEVAIEEAMAYARAHATAIAVDIETDPHTPRRQTALWMVGMSWGDAGTLIIPFRRVTGQPWWPERQRERIYAALRGLLLAPDIVKVFHNHTFDVPILERHLGLAGYAVRGSSNAAGVQNIADTMVAHHAVCSELSHSLAFVATLYTDARFWKDTVKDGGKWNPPSDEVFALYCARDCLTTWRIWEGAIKSDLRGKLKGAESPVDVTGIYKHGMEVAKKVLMPLHENGMRFDLEKAQEVRTILTAREAECRDKMQVLLAPTDYAARMEERSKLAKAKDTQARYLEEAKVFHPGGLWAIRCALEGLKVPIQERTATGLLATGQEILAKAAPYATPAGRDFVRLLIGSAEGKAGNVGSMGWRACVKLRTTYLEKPQLDVDGRLHADWRMLTFTGRFSSSPNCQNFPGFMRAVLIPEPGYVFAGADFARVEWHAQAYLSGDRMLLKLFEEEDPHDVNAKLIFGERYEKAEKDVKKRLRRLAKCVAPETTIWGVGGPVGTIGGRALREGAGSAAPAVVLDEIVVGHVGRPVRAIQLFSHGLRAMVEVATAGGRVLRCGPTHKLMTYAGDWVAAQASYGVPLRTFNVGDRALDMVPDVVASVRDVGLQPALDLGVDDPAHAWVANGIVCSNSFVYGLGYGASDMTIWENLVTEWPELKPADVRAVSKRMKVLYPTWFRWRDDLLDFVRMCGYLRSAVTGRVRYFLGGLEATEILNNKAQAFAADAANIAAIKLHDAFESCPEVLLVNQSHDSLTYECPEDRAEWVTQTIKEIMPGPYHINYNVPGYPFDQDVTFGVDVKVGKDWSQV